MKDQYFGDVNDYKKYGILRALAADDVRLLVAWMLTPGDQRTDGKFLDYLDAPIKWRGFDPDLFDFLRGAISPDIPRRVDHIERWEGIRATYLSELVSDQAGPRAQWQHRLKGKLDGHDLVFFDPDNGIEVSSCIVGRKDSSKYVLWRELELAWSHGASLLVYQHFIREERTQFLARLGSAIAERLDAPDVMVLRTSNVAFFLVPQRHWLEVARTRARQVVERWRPKISLELPLGDPR